MMSAHGRSFFLYSNGIVSPMKAMFVHEIDIHVSGFVRWTSGWIVVFPSWVGFDGLDPYFPQGPKVRLIVCFWHRPPLNTGLECGCFFNRVSISSVFIMHCSQTRLVCFYQFRSRCQILHTGRCWWSLPELRRNESPHVNYPVLSLKRPHFRHIGVRSNPNKVFPLAYSSLEMVFPSSWYIFSVLT